MAVILTDKELEQAIGGVRRNRNNRQVLMVACCKCHRNFNVDIQKSEAACPKCGTTNYFAG